jgi:L-histidine N-alpha-methyltransferase
MKDAHRGLTARQKSIPSKYFYDARGSELFEEICFLPEYYPTRTEMNILERAAPHIMGSFKWGDIVELGSGANLKIRMLLDAADESDLSHYRYVPVDVSETALIEASEELLGIYPELEVLGIVADFTIHMDVIPSDRPRFILFLGSTIGNFDERTRSKFLRHVARSMKHADKLLIGFDMLKSRNTLEAAYNDSRGVTSAFNKNVLHVLNRELRADFDPSHFDHVAFFNEDKERVEMHLQANRRVEVQISELGLEIELDKDETIHTEICNKFSREGVERLVSEAGFYINKMYFDSKGWFSLAELVLKDR